MGARFEPRYQRPAGLRLPALSQRRRSTGPGRLHGAVWAGRSAVREDWRELAISVAVMLIAAGSALAGPRGMWLSDGVGCCVVLLANAGALALLSRSAPTGS